ncbi:MAG TPA: CbiQ family ECF transporter T component [Opitutaceae bacterium]|nr:CbiQ family ECF transporter T component [Opitutaceae bacterium]
MTELIPTVYPTDRPVYRWPAGVKLAGALVLVVGTALAPLAWRAWFAGVAMVLLLVVVLGRLPVKSLLLRLLALSPFVAGVALAAALNPGGAADWRVLALRSGLCLATVLVLAQTTPFTAMLAVLRRVRVPALLVTTLALMHRYLFVLGDESERMRRARASRTFTADRRLAWWTAATVVGQLFVRASERAERVYDAMCARGWR